MFEFLKRKLTILERFEIFDWLMQKDYEARKLTSVYIDRNYIRVLTSDLEYRTLEFQGEDLPLVKKIEKLTLFLKKEKMKPLKDIILVLPASEFELFEPGMKIKKEDYIIQSFRTLVGGLLKEKANNYIRSFDFFSGRVISIIPSLTAILIYNIERYNKKNKLIINFNDENTFISIFLADGEIKFKRFTTGYNGVIKILMQYMNLDYYDIQNIFREFLKDYNLTCEELLTKESDFKKELGIFFLNFKHELLNEIFQLSEGLDLNEFEIIFGGSKNIMPIFLKSLEEELGVPIRIEHLELNTDEYFKLNGGLMSGVRSVQS